MKNKIISIVTIGALLITGIELSSSKQVSAEGLDSIRKQIGELEKQQDNTRVRSNKINQEQQETQSRINSNVAEQQKINEQIRVLDEQVAVTQAKLSEKELEIKATEKAIEQKLEEIAQMEQNIKDRNELLKGRFTSLQKSGGDVSYFEVVMGAKSFGDLLTRATAVNKIMGQDKKIMDMQIEEKRMLEEAKKELEIQKANLVKQKEELSSLKASLERQRIEKDRLMDQLKEQETELKSYQLELKEEEEIVRKQQATILKMIEEAKQEEGRIKAKEEEERRKAAAAAAAAAASQNTPTVSQSNGIFSNPVTHGRLTSSFGPRWGANHNGIDIGKTVSGQVPIMASAEGVVNRSYYSPSYGNVVFITHYINGKVYTTVYAHMVNREVSEGQRVSRGQRLGIMGTTGYSTGIHLHFEIHEGPWLPDHSNSVNPLRYVNY